MPVACYLYRRFSGEGGYYLFSAIFLYFVMCIYFGDFFLKTVSSFTFLLLFVYIKSDFFLLGCVAAWNHLFVSVNVGRDGIERGVGEGPWGGL